MSQFTFLYFVHGFDIRTTNVLGFILVDLAIFNLELSHSNIFESWLQEKVLIVVVSVKVHCHIMCCIA